MPLSTGTLNLRFMQNARKASRIEPEQVHVKDDAEWEISRPDAYRGEKAVTYETSYLPFLFPSLHESSLSPSNTLRPRGRRVFNKQHVTNEASSQSNIVQETTRVPTSKDAKNIIFDTSRVGTDLRPSPSTFLRPAGVDGPNTASQPSTGDIQPKRSRTSGEPDKATKKTKLTLIE